MGVCLPCDQRIGPGDTYIITEISKLQNRPTLVALATKTDLVSKERQLSHLVDVGEVAEELGIRWAEVVPCSAETGENVDVVGDILLGLLPPGPMYYPDGEITDEPEETLIAELIREAALEGVRDELPHSIAVMIDEILPREGRPEDKPLLDVHFRDARHGWVAGAYGLFFETRNGGRSWSSAMERRPCSSSWSTMHQPC